MSDVRVYGAKVKKNILRHFACNFSGAAARIATEYNPFVEGIEKCTL